MCVCVFDGFEVLSMTDREILERPPIDMRYCRTWMRRGTAGYRRNTHHGLTRKETGVGGKYLSMRLIASRPVMCIFCYSLSCTAPNRLLHGRIRAHPTRRISRKTPGTLALRYVDHTHRVCTSSRMYI